MTGNVALVTGAAQGLGRAFSEVLLRRGAKVCVTDIQEQSGNKTVEDFNKEFGKDAATFIKCDVSKQKEIKDVFEEAENRLGKLDIVVNNAGVLDEKDWEKMLDINLKAVITGTLLAVESMRTDKGGNGGHIINIASMAGLFPVPFAPVYAACKHGVVGISRSFGDKSFKELGLKVNCLCPAYTDTDILKTTIEKISYNSHMVKDHFKYLGILDISTAARAFEKLLDDDRHGGVLMVGKRLGMDYMRFPMDG